MSFLSSRPYKRSILEPIVVPSTPRGNEDRSGHLPSNEPNVAPLWTSTTHTFSGTGNRASTTSWPPSQFSQDPADISDDPKHYVDYDEEVAKGPVGGGVYRMYGDAAGSANGEGADVPAPRLVAKRYLPKQDNHSHGASKPALTLLMLPAMGVPKETYEPMIEGFLAGQNKSEFSIAEIWSLDLPMSGATALANPQAYLYGSQKDIARDILLFITAYMPLQAQQDLPTELVARPLQEQSQQLSRPNLHVIAHSMGAQSAMLVATHAPDLFASLTLFDPAMFPGGPLGKKLQSIPKSMYCRGLDFQHESKSSLLSQLKRNKRTRSWDPRIMEIFAEHGLVESPSGGLQLTAHPRLELALYFDGATSTQCYDRFADLSLPINAIMPARPLAVPAKMLEEDFGKLPGKTRLTWVPKSTHQLPLEHVDLCAELVSAWLRDVSQGAKARL